jgi:hypothetical protein
VEDGGIDDAGDSGVSADAAPPRATLVGSRALIAGIASDANNVYWTEPGMANGVAGGVYRLTAAGGVAPVEIAIGRTDPGVIVVDDAAVFWNERHGQGIVRAPIGGGAATPMPIAGQNTTQIAIDGAWLYWNDDDATMGADNHNGQVRRVHKDGTGQPEPIVASIVNGPWAIATDGTNVSYVKSNGAGAGEADSIELSGASAVATPVVVTRPTARIVMAAGNVACVSDSGGSIVAGADKDLLTSATPLATGQGQITSLAADAAFVYWVHQAGGSSASLERAAWNRMGGIQTLVTGIAAPGPITVNATKVFYVDNAIVGLKAAEIKSIAK